MKKILSLLFLVFAGYGSYAQTVNTTFLNPMQGDSRYKFLELGSSGNVWGGLMMNNNTSDKNFGNGDDVSLFTYGDRDLTFRTGTGNFIIFPTLGGRVGVGTASPQVLYHIQAGNTREQLRLQSGGNANAYFDLEFAVNSSSGIPTGSAYGWIMSHRKDGYFTGNTGGSTIEFYGVKVGGGYVAPLAFKSNGDVILASPRQATSGNVGIGTINPDSKLTVAGNIHAREVKVTVTAGADFVFADDYALPDLKAVEAYVKENKHLPEIASAAEMEANGLLLAEMNIKLLQKVEELTLYTIQQEKELEKQRKANEEQQALIQQLISRMELLEQK